MKFNEDSRVKIPAILHCMRLGFEYVSLKKQSPNINESTNIFSDVFLSSIQKINPGLTTSEARQALDEISLVLENEDLGRTFYKKLINRSGVRLIDYENIDQNTFQVVTELTYKNGEDEFRPDMDQGVNFAIVKESVKELNLVPEIGDIVIFNNNFFEVDALVENQLILGKDPDYAISSGATDFGNSHSIILSTHMSRVEKLNLIPLRGGVYPSSNKVTDDLVNTEGFDPNTNSALPANTGIYD